MSDSETIARFALAGVGDAKHEWKENGAQAHGVVVVHVRRRLTAKEQSDFNIPCARDIRGSPEEQQRIHRLLTEAPFLKRFFA